MERLLEKLGKVLNEQDGWSEEDRERFEDQGYTYVYHDQFFVDDLVERILPSLLGKIGYAIVFKYEPKFYEEEEGYGFLKLVKKGAPETRERKRLSNVDEDTIKELEGKGYMVVNAKDFTADDLVFDALPELLKNIGYTLKVEKEEEEPEGKQDVYIKLEKI